LYPATAELLEFHVNATECVADDTPVPYSAMVAGEFLALLVIVRLPIKFPIVKGVNVACTETL
jgi:hypothetical protein